MQKSSLAYCILVLLTNSNVLGKLNIWKIQELLLADLAKTQYTRDDEIRPYSRINLDQRI